MATAGLALAGGSEWLVRTQVLPQDTMARHIDRFTQTRSPYVAFGDSHIARGFNPSPPIVNLAYPSENLDRMIWKANRYFASSPSPKTVLLQATPHLFADYRIDAGLGDYPEIFSADEKRLSVAFSERYRPQLLMFWRRFLFDGGQLRSKIEQTPSGALLSPGDLSRWSTRRRTQFARDRALLHTPSDSDHRERVKAAYEHLVQAFLNRGAHVCLAAPPVSPDYRKTVAGLPKKNRERWLDATAFFEQLADDPRVRFVDHRNLVDTLDHFRDPDHLNKKGALAYSPILEEACFGDEIIRHRMVGVRDSRE